MSITEETRREGHASVDKTARYALILGVLRGRQMTAREIARVLGFTDLNAVKPRLTELKRSGAVAVTGKRKDKVTGVHVAVYAVKEENEVS